MADLGTGYNPGNLDLATQQAELERKRQLAQALLLRSMQEQPTQMAGQVAIRNGPLSAIGKILTSYFANKSMTDANDAEKKLVNDTEDKQSQALQDLMNSTRAQPGTPTKITEQAGSPDAQGNPSMSVEPGTPGGLDQAAFAKAMAKATRSGVNPAVIGSMLTKFNRDQFLSGIPGMQQYVPGMQGAAPTVTPGNANGGAQMTMPAGAPAAPGGGGMYGVPDVVTAMNLSGDPALEKQAAVVAKYAEPQNMREGGSLTRLGPNGQPEIALTAPKLPEGTRMVNGAIEPIPGYMSTKGAILSKEEAIKAGFKPITITNSDNTSTQGYLDAQSMFHPFQMAGTGNAPGAAPGVAPAPGFTPTAPGARIPSAVQSQADSGRMSILRNEQAQRQTQGLPPDPALEREIQLAQSAPAGTSFNRTQSTQSKAEAEGVGGNLAKQQEAVDEGARTATAGMARTQEMRATLDAFTPNAAAPTRQKLAEFAQAAGLPEATVTKIAGGDVSAMQVFVKHSFGNSTELIRTALGPGQRITQMEMAQQYKNSANPSLTRSAITAMLDFQEGGYRWMQDKQQMKDAYVQQKGTYAGFEGWWNRNHPLNGPDLEGKPYIPTPEMMKAAFTAKAPQPTQGLGTQQVSGAIGSGSPAGWSITKVSP